MSYGEIESHFAWECKEMEVSCLLGCSSKFLRSGWENHFDQHNPNFGKVCEACGSYLNKEEIVSHDCLEYLMAKSNDLQGRIEALTLEED